MSNLHVRDITPAFGAEIRGFDPKAPLDVQTRQQLRDLFDSRKLLIFPELDLSHAEQIRLSTMLIGKDASDSTDDLPEDSFYVSNSRPDSAAPFGRLQFHVDTMWSDRPFEVLSLYGLKVEQPAASTTFISGVEAWKTLPEPLRKRIADLEVRHTAAAIRRGDTSDVLVTEVDNPPFTVTKLAHRHPRTGETILYACEQMTQEIVGLEPSESEELLQEVFAHLYRPAGQIEHFWHERDFVVFDNIALQHARGNVERDGPVRTLRKAASPMPTLSRDERPVYSMAEA